jgi:soluble cytochrome b562
MSDLNFVASMQGNGPDTEPMYKFQKKWFIPSLDYATAFPAADSLIQMTASSLQQPASNMKMPQMLRRSSIASGQQVANKLFDDLPGEDAFEPVPIGKHSTCATTVDIALLQSILGQALDKAIEVEDFESSNKKRCQAQDATSAKRQRTSRTGPRFRAYQEKQWVQQFDELLKFKQERGHCLVPHTFDENPTLSRWIKRQRYQYKLKKDGKVSTMTDARIQKLQDAGFVWDSHAAAWQERYNELKEYLAEHGDCNVPSNYSKNPQLATWVKCQRRQCKLFWNGKSSNMTLDRIFGLNQLGFAWKLRNDQPLSPSATPF